MQHQPLVTTPRKPIRTDFFTTRERPSTLGCWIRYTGTLNDPRIDAVFIDDLDGKKKYFGCTYHYLIRSDGTIELGRDPKTISSVGKKHVQPHQIVIGVVGGLAFGDNGSVDQAATDTPEQEASVEWLLQALADTLNVPLEITDGREFLQQGRHLEAIEPHDENGETIPDNDKEETLSTGELIL